jgi:hypothetical protein
LISPSCSGELAQLLMGSSLEQADPFLGGPLLLAPQ